MVYGKSAESYLNSSFVAWGGPPLLTGFRVFKTRVQRQRLRRSRRSLSSTTLSSSSGCRLGPFSRFLATLWQNYRAILKLNWTVPALPPRDI